MTHLLLFATERQSSIAVWSENAQGIYGETHILKIWDLATI